MQINEEYLSYTDYLKSINFEEKLVELEKKYKNKRILLFGAGVFLDAIIDNYDLKSRLNIIGICDKTYVKSDEHKGFNTYSPSAIRTLGVNVILNAELSLMSIKKYLKENNFTRSSVEIENIIQYDIVQKFLMGVRKSKAVIGYFKKTLQPFETIFSLFTKTAEEIEIQAEYACKVKKLQSDTTKQMRVMFICNEPAANIVNLYNKMNNDDTFKVLPIVVVPSRLFDAEPVDEDLISKTMVYFDELGIKTIFGFDEESGTVPCVTAFKPDLVFYQAPKYIKDYYSPKFISNASLCWTIADKNSSVVSQFVQKQLSHMWQVFDVGESSKEIIQKIKNKLAV